MKRIKPIQFVNWFPYWKGLKIKKTNPLKDENAGYFLIYKWFVLLGFWEIRKFMTEKERKVALKLYKSKNK